MKNYIFYAFFFTLDHILIVAIIGALLSGLILVKIHSALKVTKPLAAGLLAVLLLPPLSGGISLAWSNQRQIIINGPDAYRDQALAFLNSFDFAGNLPLPGGFSASLIEKDGQFLNQFLPIKPPWYFSQLYFNMTFIFLENTTISSVNETLNGGWWTLSLNNTSQGIPGESWVEQWVNSSVISPVNQTVLVNNFMGLNVRLSYYFEEYGGYVTDSEAQIYAFLDLSGNPILALEYTTSPGMKLI